MSTIRVTERDMLDALHGRYCSTSPGNGARYVVAEHVRSAASWDSRRTADFMALDTWLSGNLDLIGHEVKVSRSDWLRELKHPEKAAEFTPFCNRWFVVVPDAASIVRSGELPDGWGLLALNDSGTLRMVRGARRQRTDALPTTRMVALARAVQKTSAQQQARGANPCPFCMRRRTAA